MDKSNTLEDMILSLAAASGDGSSPCVYVGDSIGDLAALLVANIPIVLGSNAMLDHALSTFGCTRHPLGGGAVTFEENPYPPGHVLVAESWQQIHEFLFPAERMREDGVGMAAGGTAPVTPPAPGSAQRMISGTISASDSGMGLLEGCALREVLPARDGPAVVPPRVLVVAGSDSGGGAGIQADVRACMACGTFASTAITALTAQNSQGVSAVHVPPVATLEAQLEAVLGDIGADVIKTGMLPNAELVITVAQAVQKARESEGRREGGRGWLQVVVDPVLVSTSGSELGGKDVVPAIKEHLFPLATLVTPNLAEASALVGPLPLYLAPSSDYELRRSPLSCLWSIDFSGESYMCRR
jgi:hypothetical protein